MLDIVNVIYSFFNIWRTNGGIFTATSALANISVITRKYYSDLFIKEYFYGDEFISTGLYKESCRKRGSPRRCVVHNSSIHMNLHCWQCCVRQSTSQTWQFTDSTSRLNCDDNFKRGQKYLIIFSEKA